VVDVATDGGGPFVIVLNYESVKVLKSSPFRMTEVKTGGGSNGISGILPQNRLNLLDL
jgi:hypothetical protein